VARSSSYDRRQGDHTTSSASAFDLSMAVREGGWLQKQVEPVHDTAATGFHH
jgi:hypothetical protein